MSVRGGAPAFTDATVHDPDHILVDGTHYVIGSHLQAASSPDLLNWTQVAEGVNPENPLFDDVTQELSEALEWAETDTLWAPDIIQLADGRFYLYYDACRGDSPLSAMGIAVADEVTGPYEDLGLILRSGMSGESEDGTPFDARVHPNVIDPDVFYDADGALWMVYGSFSGGLFILELDPETGFPTPGQGYGKHLWGGNHSRIEGPAMVYDEETGFYYLFVTYGGLDAGGGYNIRVARSENPDGPFVDAEGIDMAEVKSDPTLPLFDDVTIAESGVKLMGNHRLGDASEGDGLIAGYVSPGGSSPFIDEDGNRLIVFHTRFPGRGEAHQVRVHEWATDADGWPVISPLRWAGEPDRAAEADDVPGTYTLVYHGPRTISPRLSEPEEITLADDGTVTGERTGSWTAEGSRVLLALDGDTVTAEAFRQWDETAETWVTTLSGVGSGSTALWAVPQG
ncbi:glycoside hydrolase family 43 protein [Tessaracoccus sp. G1721]